MKLIDKYLPSDYSDSVSKRTKQAEPGGPVQIIFSGYASKIMRRK